MPYTQAYSTAETAAAAALRASGIDEATIARSLEALRVGGLVLSNAHHTSMLCSWVPVAERAVPPEADTIIRTITRTTDGRSTSYTYWLEGLRAPMLPPY